ncbi:MAG: hypothetical protein EOO91_03895 [Pedobacter sp.]|nr:MAG: hypothetical protein EOO91_03895 [Pedobacter sp.]
MQPFNIKIKTVGQEITLTVLPQDDEYKIIYFGGIIGGLRQENDELHFIKPEDVIPGGLPLYKYKQADSTAAEEEIKLTKEVLLAIKNEVKSVISLQSPT